MLVCGLKRIKIQTQRKMMLKTFLNHRLKYPDNILWLVFLFSLVSSPAITYAESSACTEHANNKSTTTKKEDPYSLQSSPFIPRDCLSPEQFSRLTSLGATKEGLSRKTYLRTPAIAPNSNQVPVELRADTQDLSTNIYVKSMHIMPAYDEKQTAKYYPPQHQHPVSVRTRMRLPFRNCVNRDIHQIIARTVWSDNETSIALASVTILQSSDAVTGENLCLSYDK